MRRAHARVGGHRRPARFPTTTQHPAHEVAEPWGVRLSRSDWSTRIRAHRARGSERFACALSPHMPLAALSGTRRSQHRPRLSLHAGNQGTAFSREASESDRGVSGALLIAVERNAPQTTAAPLDGRLRPTTRSPCVLSRCAKRSSTSSDTGGFPTITST
jgi:hypothetical protein